MMTGKHLIFCTFTMQQMGRWAFTISKAVSSFHRYGFFDAWGLPPGEHYSKRANHGQERSWRAEVQIKKKYIQQMVYALVLVST